MTLLTKGQTIKIITNRLKSIAQCKYSYVASDTPAIHSILTLFSFFKILYCYRKIFLLMQLHMRVFVYRDKKKLYLFVLCFASFILLVHGRVQSTPFQSNQIQQGAYVQSIHFIHHTSTFILLSIYFISVSYYFYFSIGGCIKVVGLLSYGSRRKF